MPTLQFKGKNIIWNHHLSVPYHTLEEVEDLHYQPEKGNGNLIIEGDNLIALKALLPEYAGKVKCIYIDPPYNTGNEGWVYNDKVNSPLINNWLGQTVGTDDLTRHDKWLCMMTPRLKMLRDLLSDDGAIFISIDNSELSNLISLMNEIYGEENFVEIFMWNKTSTPPSLSSKSRKTHEYIVCFEKEKNNAMKYVGLSTNKDGDQPLLNAGNGEKTLRIPANKVKFNIEDKTYLKGIYHRIELIEDLIVKNGLNENELVIRGEFKWQQSFLNNELNNNTTFIVKSNKFSIRFLRTNEEEGFIAPNNFIRDEIISTTINKNEQNVTTNESAGKELKELSIDNFDYPKPVSLIKYLCSFLCDSNSIILDSFAGSGTTMHAVNELNKEDGGNRKCILVQMKEDSEAEPDKNICQNITRERVKIAIEKYGYENGFKYLKVGTAIDPEKMLEGQLPTYEQFAKYIYYLGTGEHLAAAQNINAEKHFVGTHGAKAFFLIYEQDFETLTRLALNLSIAEDIVQHSPNKRSVIYAPACFLDSDYMEEKQIEFVSIPYNLFERQTN